MSEVCQKCNALDSERKWELVPLTDFSACLCNDCHAEWFKKMLHSSEYEDIVVYDASLSNREAQAVGGVACNMSLVGSDARSLVHQQRTLIQKFCDWIAE